jgi:hypothetical protein
MVGTLLDAAPPGQERPTRADYADLLRSAAARWGAEILLPAPSSRPFVAALLARVLPFVLLYPATKVLAYVLHWSSVDDAALMAMRGGLWPGATLWPAWALWAMGCAALLLGLRRTVLVLLGASTVVLAALTGVLLTQGHTLEVSRAVGWLVTQGVVLVATLAAPRPPDGRAGWWAAAGLWCGALAVTASLASLGELPFPVSGSMVPVWAYTPVVPVALLVLLATRLRPAVPALAAVVTAVSVGRFGLGMSPRSLPVDGPAVDLQQAVLLVLAPCAVYVAAGLVAATVRSAVRPAARVTACECVP